MKKLNCDMGGAHITSSQDQKLCSSASAMNRPRPCSKYMTCMVYPYWTRQVNAAVSHTVLSSSQETRSQRTYQMAFRGNTECSYAELCTFWLMLSSLLVHVSKLDPFAISHTQLLPGQSLSKLQTTTHSHPSGAGPPLRPIPVWG